MRMEVEAHSEGLPQALSQFTCAYYFKYGCSASMSVYPACACQVPVEAREGTRSHRVLCATMWILGPEPSG